MTCLTWSIRSSSERRESKRIEQGKQYKGVGRGQRKEDGKEEGGELERARRRANRPPPLKSEANDITKQGASMREANRIVHHVSCIAIALSRLSPIILPSSTSFAMANYSAIPCTGVWTQAGAIVDLQLQLARLGDVQRVLALVSH